MGTTAGKWDGGGESEAAALLVTTAVGHGAGRRVQIGSAVSQPRPLYSKMRMGRTLPEPCPDIRGAAAPDCNALNNTLLPPSGRYTKTPWLSDTVLQTRRRRLKTKAAARDRRRREACKRAANKHWRRIAVYRHFRGFQTATTGREEWNDDDTGRRRRGLSACSLTKETEKRGD